jgi:hypothetical protein
MNVIAAFREHSENPMRSMPRHLARAETWASNKWAASLVELPGLSAWVRSVSVGPGQAGGFAPKFSLKLQNLLR